MPPTDIVLRKRISAKNFLLIHVGLFLLAVVIWVAGAKTQLVSVPIVFVLGLFPLAIGLLYSWLVRISTEYRVFSDSLEVESGIIAKNIENIQFYRVRDFGLTQSFVGRILNFGNVYVISTDQSDPHLVLRGIDDPRDVYQTMRELVAKSQAARRTMIVEEELPSTVIDS